MSQVEQVSLLQPQQQHRLADLPVGKYIVCGEARRNGRLIQSSCFETIIEKLDNNSELSFYYFSFYLW